MKKLIYLVFISLVVVTLSKPQVWEKIWIDGLKDLYLTNDKISKVSSRWLLTNIFRKCCTHRLKTVSTDRM